jgi:hypothetical protein
MLCLLKKKASVFSESLEQNTEKDGQIPYVITACIEEVERRGMDSVGIYRVSGNSTSIQELKKAFMENPSLLSLHGSPWANEDINIITSTLKLYFRELPIPITTFEYYDELINAIQIADYNQRLIEIKQIIRKFPLIYYKVLQLLILHLSRIASYSDLNKMDCSNLAIVFGPTLMRSRDPAAHIVNMGHQNAVIEAMVSQAEWLFDDDEQSENVS